MDRLVNWCNLIIKKQKGLKRWQRVVTVLAAMITFATTYALILPAITVEKNSTEDVGGMYLEKTAKRDDLLEDNALEPVGVSIAADMDNAVSFAYSDDDMTATAIFSTDEIIPEGAELVVNNVTSDSEEYADLSGRAADLLDKEFIYDVTSCSFYDFALVCDNVDVTPKTGMVDIQIIFRNNTNQHVNDVIYAGRFARQSEDADRFVAMAVSTAEAEAEADDTVSMNGTAVNDNSAGESGDPSAGEDELVSLNIDESSVIELSDGIITSLSLKGSDLSRSDSLVGIIAGYVDEEIKAAAAETDAEVPEYDESQDEDAPRSSGEDASGNADNNVSTSPEENSSETSAEDERKEITDALQMKTLKASGRDYTVTLTYDESSKIPEGASLTVSEISKDSKEYQTYLEETKKAMGLKEEETLPGLAARFFDIKIMVGGKEFNPESGVSVEITYAEPLAEYSETEVNAVHFADEKAEAEVIEANTAEVQDDGKATVEFTAESFSVYGVIYTVDFHWEVNGKMFNFSIPGGGFVSLKHLVEVLGIASADENMENGTEFAQNGAVNDDYFVGEEPGADVSGENGEESMDKMDDGEASLSSDSLTYEEAIKLNEVEISEATKKFVADVENVEFSNPELVWVGKANESATVGGLKEVNGLEVQYSAELTEEQIDEINAQIVESGDWALISMGPFSSEESLTVTMKNGDQWIVKVTDALVTDINNVEQLNPYILYAVYEGQYYALKNDGTCYKVPGNDLDSLGDEFFWCTTTESIRIYNYTYNLNVWRSYEKVGNGYNYINLFNKDLNTAVQDYACDISATSVSNSDGYKFTYSYYDFWSWSNKTHSLWLYHDMDNDEWRFASGEGQGNDSVIYIYEQNPLHKLTVNVEDDETGYGHIRLNGSNTGVSEGETDITRNGTNKRKIVAVVDLEDNYQFDHWLLDGERVEETDDFSSYEEGGKSYGVIDAGALNIGNEDGRTLTAVFSQVPHFDVIADPEEHGSVNRTMSFLTRDGYNKESISAAAGNGYWFDHWEIRTTGLNDETGELEQKIIVLPEANYPASSDGLSCSIPAGSLKIDAGATLAAVFKPQIRYTVEVASETEGGVVGDCKVQVGNSAAASILTDEVTRLGYNLSDIKANAAPGFVFVRWMLDDEPILGDADINTKADGSESAIAAGTLQVSPDRETHTVKAVFKPAYNFTVTTYPGGGGTVRDGDKPADSTIRAALTNDNYNTNQITAIASNGYKFHHWTKNGQPMEEGEGDQKHYLYADGIIPARALELITSSDSLCAVFVKERYTITVVAGDNGRVSSTTVYTETNADEQKKALNTITATPNNANNYKFAYWRVDNPYNAVVNWGDNKTVRNDTIQPTVSDDVKLTAVFVSRSQRVFTVTVDDPGHGTVYGKDVTGNNVTNDGVGVTSYAARTRTINGRQVNYDSPQVRTAAPGYEFLGWNLYKDGTLVKSYEDNDEQGNQLKKWQPDKEKIYFDYDDMVLKAMFQKKADPVDFDSPALDGLNDWAEDKANTKFTSEKEAEVFDYDNRIYRISMSASSEKESIDSSVVLNFITDASRSMYFPANIEEAGSYNGNLNGWLSGKNTNNVYYVIKDQTTSATLHAVYYDGTKWVTVDASYYPFNSDDGMTKEGTAASDYGSSSGDDYKIYRAYYTDRSNNKIYQTKSMVRNPAIPWNRLDYLAMSVEAAVKAIYNICPNAQIDLTTFNRSATYKGTIPNNHAAIEMLVRNIDCTGGTRTDLGLAEAYGHFTEQSSKRQVAVLVTDGAPQASGSNTTPEAIISNATTTAEAMKTILDAEGKKLELYTMGLSLNTNTNQFLAGLASTGDGYHNPVNTGEEIADTIKNIIQNLLTNVSLFGEVCDTVDPAFYPVDKNGEPVKAGYYAMNGQTLANQPEDNTPYYEWEYNGNTDTWKITWHNQTIAWEKEVDGTAIPGWQNEFYIKAKEDFLGGNIISTNSGDKNGITASGYVKADTSVSPLVDIENNPAPVTKYFDYTPYVNIDELHMDSHETEWTVYLGTEVDPKTQLVNLLKQIQVKQVVKKEGTDSTGLYITDKDQMFHSHSSDAVNNDDKNCPGDGKSQTLPLTYYVDSTNPQIVTAFNNALTQLVNSTDEQSVTVDKIKYNEYGHAAGEFAITLTKKVNTEAAEDQAPNPHETKLVGDKVEEYTITVMYTPYTDDANDTYTHTTEGGSAGRVTNGVDEGEFKNEVKSENKHIINVIVNGIQVIKTDATTGEPITDNNPNDGVDYTADFGLYRALKVGETSDKKIMVDGEEMTVVAVTDGLVTGGALQSAQLDSLPWYASADEEHDGYYFLREERAPYSYLMLTNAVTITVTPLDHYKNLKGEDLESIENVPYNNVQTVEVKYLPHKGDMIPAPVIDEVNHIHSVTVADPQKGSMAIRKLVQVSGDDTNINDMNGLYKFYLYGPVGSNAKVSYYVTLKVENGEMTEYWFKKFDGSGGEVTNPDNNALLLEPEKHGNVTDQSIGYLITDMETGIYAVKEIPWQLDSNNENDITNEIYLKDIIVDPGEGGNTNDVVEKKTSVFVVADDPNAEKVLTTTFINEYATNVFKFGVQKKWYDSEGNELTGPWNRFPGIASIEFSVTQTDADGNERVLVFDNSERITITRYGRCAWVKPKDDVKGSDKYEVEWKNGGNEWSILISGLEEKDPDGNPYTYKIKELCIRDVYQNVVTGYQTTYDLSENGGSLVVENGQNIGIASIKDGATAYIGNREITDASLKLRKHVEASTLEPIAGDLTMTDGSYQFTIIGPEEQDDPPVRYVQINTQSTNSGTADNPTYTTVYTYQIGNKDGEEIIWGTAQTPDANGFITIDHLAPGRYSIIETGWTLENTPEEGYMTLQDIDVTDGSNNTAEKEQKKAQIFIGDGEVSIQSVTFTNAMVPYPGIQIVKIDESTRPVSNTTRYLSGAEFQLFKWNGSKYAVYPDMENSKAVTGDNGVAEFISLEPGEYQIVETVIPNGYVKPDVNDFFFKVEFNSSTCVQTITRYAEAYTGNNSTARTVVSETENLTGVTFAQATEDSLAAFTVGNEPGAALPNTGGSGTVAFYLLGIMLAGLAGTGLVMRKRRRDAV